MVLILMRHPMTEANEKGLIYGRRDYPLSLAGHALLDEVDEKTKNLDYDLIVSSPLKRAMVLAEKLGAYSGKPIVTLGEFQEMDYGEMEGYTPSQVQISMPGLYRAFIENDLETLKKHGVEPYDAFCQRLMKGMEQVGLLGDTILLVTHGGVIRTLLILLANLTEEEVWSLSIEPGSWLRLSQQSDGWQLDK